MGRVKTRRWDDPVEPDDGYRLLVCRYRPRALPKEDETWDSWDPGLGPSRALHAAAYGKDGPPLPFEEYAPRYLSEMQARSGTIGALAARVADGETITLLCSSACDDPSRCHRTLLAALVEERAASLRR